jgi:glyoxylase-like metal-dependent hydrolase (beta-lactamase superfamily II)
MSEKHRKPAACAPQPTTKVRYVRAMNPAEAQLVYPQPQAPAPGSVVWLRPGLGWLRMPLPFALDHINLWLLEDEIDGRRGWTAVDCGITSVATQAAWRTLFDTVFDGRPLLRVIATHFHPDHLGLAHWLCAGADDRGWAPRLWMSATEYAFGRFLISADAQRAGDAAAAHFTQHGLTDPESLATLRTRGVGYFPKWVPAVPTSYRRIQEGDELTIGLSGAQRRWRALTGFGHSPEHVSLHCADEQLLIAGDMVLPRISTNVGVWDTEPEGNPLPRYLRSLEQLRPLAADTLVLPSHGLPFVGLHTRIAQQQAHHRARLDEVLQACSVPHSAAAIVPVLFKRELDLHQLSFALGEALAHLHALWYEGRLNRTPDADGITRFAAA